MSSSIPIFVSLFSIHTIAKQKCYLVSYLTEWFVSCIISCMACIYIYRLFTAGLNFNPLSLYTPIKYPVSTGTPMISSLVHWDHSISWDVPSMEQFGCGLSSSASTSYTIDISEDSEDAYLVGHAIDGRILYPATGYLILAWKTFAKLNNQVYNEMPVVFDNIHIHRATILHPSGKQ